MDLNRHLIAAGVYNLKNLLLPLVYKNMLGKKEHIFIETQKVQLKKNQEIWYKENNNIWYRENQNMRFKVYKKKSLPQISNWVKLKYLHFTKEVQMIMKTWNIMKPHVVINVINVMINVIKENQNEINLSHSYSTPKAMKRS